MILNVAPHFLVLRKKQPHGFNYKNLSPFVLCKNLLYHMSTATHFRWCKLFFSSSLYYFFFFISLLFLFLHLSFISFLNLSFTSYSSSPSLALLYSFASVLRTSHVSFNVCSICSKLYITLSCIYHCITVVCIFLKKL